jgi:hypothetical protein
LHCKYYPNGMGLKITREVRKFYKQLASEGGKARAKKYDHATLSEWAKRGGRPKKSTATHEGDEQAEKQGRTSVRSGR